MTNSVYMRRWGLFFLFAAPLFILQEWLNPPAWLRIIVENADRDDPENLK
jgi:hypothetical protein